MPGSVAESQHGRRGGGWLPSKPARAAPASPPPTSDPTCSTCQRRYSAHSGAECPVCRQAVEHHDEHRERACWSGRARMARARRAAGVPLDEVDVAALARVE